MNTPGIKFWYFGGSYGLIFVGVLGQMIWLVVLGIAVMEHANSLVGHRQANLTLLWVCLVANVLYLVPNSPMFAGMRSEWCMIAALAGMLLWKLTSDFRQRRPGKMHERTN